MDMKKLTKRENEVVKLLAWGAPKKTAAYMLGVSVFTLDNHLRSIH